MKIKVVSKKKVTGFRERIAWLLVWMARRIYPDSEEVKAFMVEKAMTELLKVKV